MEYTSAVLVPKVLDQGKSKNWIYQSKGGQTDDETRVLQEVGTTQQRYESWKTMATEERCKQHPTEHAEERRSQQILQRCGGKQEMELGTGGKCELHFTRLWCQPCGGLNGHI